MYYFINLVAHLTGSVNCEDLSLEIEESKALSSTCISPFELPFHLGETARLQWFNSFFLFYFAAHRALADVQAMRDVLFCTQLKDLNDQHKKFLRPPLEQKTKYKSMVKIRERAKMLLLKFGSAISGTMAKKIATEGFDFNQLRSLRATFPDKEKFIQFLRSKGLSSICSQKLVAYFFQP